jgi:hypothetical protein
MAAGNEKIVRRLYAGFNGERDDFGELLDPDIE